MLVGKMVGAVVIGLFGFFCFCTFWCGKDALKTVGCIFVFHFWGSVIR